MSYEITARWATDSLTLAYRDARVRLHSWIQLSPIYLVDRPRLIEPSKALVRVSRLTGRGREVLIIHQRFMNPCHWLMMWRCKGGKWAWVRDNGVAWGIEISVSRIFREAGVTALVNAKPDPFAAALEAADMEYRRRRLPPSTIAMTEAKQADLRIWLRSRKKP